MDSFQRSKLPRDRDACCAHCVVRMRGAVDETLISLFSPAG